MRQVISLIALAALAALAAWVLFVPPPKSAISVTPNVPANTGETPRAAPPSEPARTEAPGRK